MSVKLKLDEPLEPGVVQVSTEYGEFKYNKLNRNVSERLVKKLVNSYARADWGRYVPILVDSKGQIMDGQHRFEARRRLGLPIYFIVTEAYDPSAVLRMNTIGQRWTMRDCISLSGKLGDPNALALLEDAESWGVPLGVMMSAAGISISGTENPAEKYTDEARDRGNTLLSHMSIFHGYKFWKRKRFVAAFRKVSSMSRYDTIVMKRALDGRGGMLMPQRTARDFELNLIEVYNHGLGADKRLNPYEV